MTIKEKYRLKKFAEEFDPFSATTETRYRGWIPDAWNWASSATSNIGESIANKWNAAMEAKGRSDLEKSQRDMAIARKAIDAGKELGNKVWRSEVISTPYSQTLDAYYGRLKDDIFKYPGLKNQSTDAIVNRLKANNLKEILDNPSMLDENPILYKSSDRKDAVKELLDPVTQLSLKKEHSDKILNNALRNSNINTFNMMSNVADTNDRSGIRNNLNVEKAKAVINLDKDRAKVKSAIKNWNNDYATQMASLDSSHKNVENIMKEMKAISDKANGIKSQEAPIPPAASPAVTEAAKNDKGFMTWVKDNWNSLSDNTKTALKIGGGTAGAIVGLYGLYKTISAVMNMGNSSEGKKRRKRRVVEEYDDDE